MGEIWGGPRTPGRPPLPHTVRAAPPASPPERTDHRLEPTTASSRPPPLCVGPQLAPQRRPRPTARYSPRTHRRTSQPTAPRIRPQTRAPPRVWADCVNASIRPHSPASECAGAGSSAVSASAQAPCPSHGGWPYRGRGWGGGQA